MLFWHRRVCIPIHSVIHLHKTGFRGQNGDPHPPGAMLGTQHIDYFTAEPFDRRDRGFGFAANDKDHIVTPLG